ncbi:MAG: N-acetylneuraminate synthase family protein [Bacteroidales bacterium]|jgi:N-acetylneuraminate synthase|nr:N-acetylneuraminate synthase family protein [Bacteroidales bacterium]
MLDIAKLSKPYLIAEIGINHNGDLQIAKKLIDATFACSWDCAKFQKRNPEKSTPEHQKNIEKETPWGKMTYLEYKYKVEFGRAEYDCIDSYCRDKPLEWSASVWDLDSLEFLAKYDLSFLKIPSAHLTNSELIIEAGKTNLPIILSTGMSTLEEVDAAVNLLNKHAKQFAVMHANSSYPAKDDELNLLVIPKLIDRYHCHVGYSGHEYGLDSTTIAVALGAKIIERHITLDHKMWGTDQSSSVEIQGMDKLYKQVSAVKKYMGDGVKKIYESELQIRKKLRGI